MKKKELGNAHRTTIFYKDGDVFLVYKKSDSRGHRVFFVGDDGEYHGPEGTVYEYLKNGNVATVYERLAPSGNLLRATKQTLFGVIRCEYARSMGRGGKDAAGNLRLK